MKKWLVGLLAAGLCAASAWAETNTVAYFVRDKAVTVMQGEAPEGSSAIYSQTYNGTSGQATGGNSITLTLTGYDGTTVTGLRLAMHSNSKTGAGSLSATCGDTVIGSIADAPFNDPSWYGAWSQIFVDVTVPVVPTVIDDDISITITASSNSLYCEEFYIDYIPAVPKFSVSLDPGADFTVELDTPTDIRAMAENATGSVDYAWTLDGEPSEVLGDTFVVDTSVSGGPHEVVCVATDTGTGATAEATVSYTVVAAPQAYTVTVADGIENGSVAVWDGETELDSPADVLEGTVLKVVATPATRSYKVESVTVTGENSGEIALENGEFAMPAENVFVTATFVERSGDLFEKITSVEELEAGAYVITGAAADGTEYAMLNEANTSTATDHIKRKETPEDVSDDSISGPGDSIIWMLAKDDTGWTIYNAEGGYVCYVPNMGNSANLEEEPSSRSHWTIAATEDGLFETTNVGDSTRVLRYNQSNPRFACYDKPTSGKSLAFYKRSGSGTFSITLDPAEDFDVIQDEEASIAATPKNAVGDVTYAWTVDGVAAETDGPVLALSTGELGEHVVVCVATDGGAEGVTAEATVSYTVVAAPAQYTVTIADGIENGSVALNLDGFPIETPIELLEGTEVTVEATPDAGFALESITVNGTPLIEGNTFVVEGDSEVSATFVESTLDTYVLVESEDDFEAGAEYLVVASKEGTFTSALKNEASGTRIAAADVSIEEDGTIKTDDATIVWKIQAGAEEGEFVLFNEAASVYAAATKNDNVAQLLENGSDALAQWTLDFTALPAVKIVSVSYSSRCLQRNSQAGNAYFATYTGTQTTPSLYKKAGPAVFGITLDPAGDFDVIQDEEASVVATAKNAVGDVTYAWTVDGVAAETDGPVLALPTDGLGEHVVVCVATDGGAEGVTAEASVKYTVVAAPALYAVTVAGGIENGTVALNLDGTPIETPINLLEGTEVTVEAIPSDGYELEAITVNGEPIGGNTFVVAGDSEVSATFTAVVDYATLPFLAEGTPFAGPWQNAKVAGMTSEGLGTDYNTEADGRGARFDNTGDWLQIKFEGTPSELSYALKGQGTSVESVSTFDVWESATGGEETWTSVANHKSGENLINGVKTNFTAELKADSRFVKFAYTEKVQGNVALFDVYIANGGFSVTVDKTGFELEQGTADTVTAEAKNGIEPYTYVWTSETEALNGEGAELAIPDTLEPGDYVVTVTATDSSDEPQTATADVTFSVVEPAAKYPVSIDIGILNGNVEADVPEAAEGDPVTLTATPDPGYKLGTITVTYGEETLEFTTSPATFEMPAAEVFVGASFVERGDEFVKITSVEDLEEGEYVITGTAPDGEYAMLAELSEGNKVYIKQKDTPEEIEGDAIAGPETSIVWRVAKVADGWTIHNDAIGFVGYVASDNTAGAEEEATAKSTWTLSESGGLFLVQNVANTARRLLYNVTSTRFACYTTAPSSTLTPLAFYKKSGPAVFTVSVDDTGFELTQGEAATVTATARNGAEPYSYVWTSETEALNGEGAELAIPDTLPAGEYTATVTATDSSAEPQTATAEVAFTVVVKYPVTIADGILNGTVEADKTEAVPGEIVILTALPAEGFKLSTFILNGTPFEGDSFEMPEGEALVSAEFAEIVKYPVIIADGILNGTVEADKEEAEAGETVTLTATPADGYKLGTFFLNTIPFAGNTFAMPEGEALITAEFVETVKVTFVPVESASDFVAGEEYLLVAYKEDAYTSAMKNTANGTRIGVDEVEIAEDGSITTDNADIVWTIRAGEGEGLYVLFSETGNVYAAGPNSAGNGAQLVEDGTVALAQWELDFAALPSIKIKSVSYSDRWLQRNKDKGNAYFATYNTEQATPLLYKKAGFAVSLDKEDGFTVEAGTADSITATALRGTEPYSYAWTGDLEGEGATLAIPPDLAEGEYAVTVTATDSSEPALSASKSIAFTVVPPVVRYAITVAEGIVGGEVTVDKELAEAGETVTVTADPAPGYELGVITVNGTPLTEGNTFVVEGDSVVSATFNEIVDYATLPFVSEQTPYSGPWYKADLPVGMTSEGLGSDYGDGAAKLNDTGDWIQVKFAGTPGKLSYWIKGNSIAATEEKTPAFAVQESVDGLTWTDVAVYSGVEELDIAKTPAEHELSEDSRFVRFFYTEKAQGNVGIYDIYIGVSGELEPVVTVTGDTTLTLDGSGTPFALELALENYAGDEYTWTNNVPFGSIEGDTFWWLPPRTGEFPVTFSAMDGERTIASATVTLTVLGVPALVFDGDDEGTVGTPVNFTVVAEYVANPTVTFKGFFEKPEGSALSAEDVVLDFPNVTFTPDVAGDYGLAFSAGTAEGGDYVEDLWIVTVAAAPAEPEVTLVDGETTVELGDYFVLEFALSNYEGEFFWIADVGEIDEDGLFTWTPIEVGEFPVVVSAVAGEETIASTTVTLTVTDEPPAPVPASITNMTIEGGQMTVEFEGDGARVVVSDDLVTWEEVETTSPYTVDMDNVRRYIGVRND